MQLTDGAGEAHGSVEGVFRSSWLVLVEDDMWVSLTAGPTCQGFDSFVFSNSV